MNSLNKVQIIGNLTRDPELKQIASKQAVCTVGVATNRYWTDTNGQKRDEAEFHNVVCWGKLAEICGQYLKKGTRVFFEGRLHTRNWDDESGIKHYRTEIVAADMIILSPKGNEGNLSYDEPEPANAVPAPAPRTSSPEMDISPDDLPF